MNPLLSLNQLSRLRKALVDYKYVNNAIQSKKITTYNYQCSETALAFFKQCGIPSELLDIAKLYKVTQKADTTKTINFKPRGKGRKPSKIMYPVRFEESQLDGLRNLGGNVSKHIRDAVDLYIENA
jgi:hypothetical protein